MGNEKERTSPLLLGLAMPFHHPTSTGDGISRSYGGAYASAMPMSSHDGDAINTVLPLPHELSFLSARRQHNLVASQPNWSTLDMSFSSSSSSSPAVRDPEPWRCKRTDGKKWRCSRDVAPDQKYCERHAHKSRARSRKHVELPPTTMTAAAADSSSSYDQPQSRFLQRKQPRFEFYTESSGKNLSASLYPPPPPYEDRHGLGFFTALNSYNNPETSNACCDYSILGSKIPSLLPPSPNYALIDAWGNECNNYEEQPPCTSSPPLSLSLSGGDKIFHEELNSCLNPTGNLNMNYYSTSDSAPPGGPLGEALCLGKDNTTRLWSFLASTQGYGNDVTTNTSNNSSKSPCDEDGRGGHRGPCFN